jgi:hypothetical protein
MPFCRNMWRPTRFDSTRWLTGGVLVGCLAQSACFVYRTAQPAVLRPNETIRVVVNRDAAFRVSEQFGLTSPLEGRLALLSEDTVGLTVWIGRAYSGTDFANARQTVPLARVDIAELQRKRFSLKRTVMATLGGVAVATILVNRLGLVELPWFEGEDPPPPPPEDPFRFQLRPFQPQR